eukprot:365180-Chlamydomonas_euryale.AAC.7
MAAQVAASQPQRRPPRPPPIAELGQAPPESPGRRSPACWPARARMLACSVRGRREGGGGSAAVPAATIGELRLGGRGHKGRCPMVGPQTTQQQGRVATPPPPGRRRRQRPAIGTNWRLQSATVALGDELSDWDARRSCPKGRP